MRLHTERKQHATVLSKKAVEDNVDVVVAVGGDGTMHECAKGLWEVPQHWAYWPVGQAMALRFHFKGKSRFGRSHPTV